MSNVKQIIALMRSRAEGDDEGFYSIALQIAASQARQGHRQAAEELRAEVDKARAVRSRGAAVPIKFASPRGNLDGLLELREPRYRLKDVVLGTRVLDGLNDVMRQQRRRDWLREHGRTPNRSLLFVGPPGSGKTMTAEALAGELHLPLFVIRLEGVITRYMGDTAGKLRLIFDETRKQRGVYLFDEFDAVGGHRTAVNDVAEMRRVLNSFLQFMEEGNSTDSLILCSTNHPGLLDRALLRRYDQVLEFDAPEAGQIRTLIASSLAPVKLSRPAWNKIIAASQGLSQAEIVRAIDDVVKAAILDERQQVTNEDVLRRLQDRQIMRNTFLEAEAP